MDIKSKQLQQQFQGYLQTPLLWGKQAVFGLHQLQIPKQKTIIFNRKTAHNLRLGKLVEQFVGEELNAIKEISILLENVQVQNEKQTIGELDCILEYDKTPIHLEIVYKFYLYDDSALGSEIAHWVGPNRNDTLIKKLTKLKEKQLPLLYNPHTKTILEGLNLKAENISQRVLFKAQLFAPHKKNSFKFEQLNEACLHGFYVNVSEINQFRDCKFYIPSKKDWLIAVHPQVHWQTYNQFSEEIKALTSQRMSPLCWIKYPNGTLEKFFVVWW
ncbi:DUF1853 family protein [Galbibacter sp.]|uniref:DUF1853 family protein n=1 Tax=Galbibacter sp. TaxID=2918471 RepID=UPI003A914E39